MARPGKKKEESALKYELKAQVLELKRLQEQERIIEEKISFTEANISNLNKNKFKLIIELGKQKRLSKKLNKKMLKDDSYIRVGDYYTANETNKKR